MAMAPGTLTRDEQRRLLEATAADPEAFRDHMLLAVALGTGLRLHELLALDIGDVALEDGTTRSRVRLRVAKGGRTADIFLPRRLQTKLRKFLVWKARGGESLEPGAPLFVSALDRRLSKRRAQQIFAMWQERAGLDQRHTFHRLRHTSVYNVYRETKDILLTQRFARHSSLLVTSIYLHPTDEDLARSIQKLRC
jgi:site-specific recombinase XerC